MRRSRQIIKEEYRNKIKNYIQCKKCSQLFTTHAQMSTNKGNSHNMKSVQMDEKMYFEIPASEIDNIKILGENVGEIINWKILCTSCRSCLGILSNNIILFAQKSVKITTIKYEAIDKVPTQSSQETQKTLKIQKYKQPIPKNSIEINRLFKKLLKYYSVQLNRFDQRLINIVINAENIEGLQKQLRSFLKFYQKWTQLKRIKQNSNSNYQEFKNNSTSH